MTTRRLNRKSQVLQHVTSLPRNQLFSEHQLQHQQPSSPQLHYSRSQPPSPILEFPQRQPHKHWRIQGALWTPSLSSSLFNFMQFFGEVKNGPNYRFALPPLGLAPPLGNPGSTTNKHQRKALISPLRSNN